MYEETKNEKKVMSSEVYARGLPALQSLYRRRFRWRDVSDHTFNVWNFPLPL